MLSIHNFFVFQDANTISHTKKYINIYQGIIKKTSHANASYVKCKLLITQVLFVVPSITRSLVSFRDVRFIAGKLKT